jgi:hypothetical protein
LDKALVHAQLPIEEYPNNSKPPQLLLEFFIQIPKQTYIVDLMHSTSLDILNEKRRALDTGDEDTIKQISESKDLISILRK